MASLTQPHLVIPSPNDGNHLGPYLKFKHVISQIWLMYPILSIIFVIFRLHLSATTAQDAVNNVKQDLLASCKAAEHAAISVTSLPRYLAVVTNKQIANAVNSTLNAAQNTMILALTALEGIINFIIDIYRSTFFCFFELLVRASLEVANGAVNAINTAISATGNGLHDAILASINGIQSVISDIVNKINSSGIVHIDAPTINVPSLDALKNVQLPQEVTDQLTILNNTIPSIDALKAKLEALVDTPFENIKTDINNTFNGLTFSVDTLPIPKQNTATLSFCNEMDMSMVDNLGDDITQVAKNGMYILIGVIVLLLIGNFIWEWSKWKARQRHLGAVRNAMSIYDQQQPFMQKKYPDHQLMWMEGMMQHPRITSCISRKEWSQQRKDKCHWFFRYIFYPPALACLLIGACGLISVEIQFAALAPLQRRYKAETAASVSNFSDFITAKVNSSMYNDSQAYALAVNTQLGDMQSTINNGVFGWVGSTTVTINSTINNFYSEMQDTAQSIFGSTPLADPVQGFIQCLIGSKVDAIENALTFLHNNIHVNLPQVDNSVLVLSPQTMAEVTQPIAQAAVGSENGQNDGLVGRIVHAYAQSLEKERIMFAIFISLWLVVVVIGLIICFCAGRRTQDLETGPYITNSPIASSTTLGFATNPPSSPMTPVRV